MTDIEYPTPAEIHDMHERIVSNNAETEPGTRKPGEVYSALVYIDEGFFGQQPETIHEKSAHLMRRIVAGHPYVDGNKRTALAAAAYLYDLNGYHLHVDRQIKDYLRSFATDSESTDIDAVVTYLRERTSEKQ